MTEAMETTTETKEYKIYVIQHHKRNDGCDFSLSDTPPACAKQDVVASFRVKKPAFGGSQVYPDIIGQLDVMLSLLKQKYPDAEFIGGQEQKILLDFAVQMLVKQRAAHKLYLATCNTGELDSTHLPFCTA